MNKLIETFRDFSRRMSAKDIPAYAASASFFIILSLVPMLVLICGIIPYTPLTEELLLRVVTDWSPDIFDAILSRIISQVYDASAGVLTISVLATLWAAGKGVMGLAQGLNRINHVKERRNAIVMRFWSCIYTLLLLAVVVLSLVMMVFGEKIVDQLRGLNPVIVENLIDLVLRPRALYMILVLTFLFAALYRFLPDAKLKYREQLPGAMLSAVAWTVFSYVFSIYASQPGAYTMYGSMTMLAIAMIWLYGCMYIFLVCAYLNRFFGPMNRSILYPKERKAARNAESPETVQEMESRKPAQAGADAEDAEAPEKDPAEGAAEEKAPKKEQSFR